MPGAHGPTSLSTLNVKIAPLHPPVLPGLSSPWLGNLGLLGLSLGLAQHPTPSITWLPSQFFLPSLSLRLLKNISWDITDLFVL